MTDAGRDLLASLGSVAAWNEWRGNHPDALPVFEQQSLYGLFSELDVPFAVKGDRARLRGIDLHGANLRFAFLEFVDLTEADLTGADLDGAILTDADLTAACLRDSVLHDANLRRASLRNANLSHANLMFAQLNEADLTGANLEGANIYGVSTWKVKVDDTTHQAGLRITPYGGEQTITVDDLEVAQFVHMLSTNRRIRQVIDTVTSKVVLILGRFTEERKVVLDALREELRTLDLVPVLFDFDPAENQDITDTVTLLARMARFVIADLTDPMSVQQELTLIAPQVMVAIQPIILAGQQPWALFPDLQRRSRGLLPVSEYQDLDDLLKRLKETVIEPAEARRRELLPVIAAKAT